MEEDEIRKPKNWLEPLILDPLGVGELENYIGELRAEIARCEAAIGRKQAHRSAADGFFKKK